MLDPLILLAIVPYYMKMCWQFTHQNKAIQKSDLLNEPGSENDSDIDMTVASNFVALKIKSKIITFKLY